MSKRAKKSAPQINRLVVIGLGLIGSSLAIAARQRGIAQHVVGISRRSSTLELALEAGVIDEAKESLDDVAAELGRGDVVVIGVPTLTVSAVLKDCCRLLGNEVTVTDVASVKGSVCRAAIAKLEPIRPRPITTRRLI